MTISSWHGYQAPKRREIIHARMKAMNVLSGTRNSFLVLLVACNGASSTAPSEAEAIAVPAVDVPRGPAVSTRSTDTIEHIEQWNERIEHWPGSAATQDDPPGPHPHTLKAASQRQFAQIWWSVSHPHGQRVTPRITIKGKIIRCDVSPTSLDGDTDSDWEYFETRIDHLPAATYRIITPKDEVTLDVPDHTIH